MKFDQKEFNFDPYIFRGDEELNYKNLKARFPENFNYMEEQFDIIKKLYGRKYIKTTFEVRDILANTLMKVVIKKYYMEELYKMTYKFNPKKKCFYYVDYNEIEKLVKEIYKDAYKIDQYSFVADIECSNDTIHEFYNIGRNKLYYPTDKYSANKIKDFIEKGELNQTIVYLMHDMAYKGIIPKGNYIISVSW